MKKYNFYNSENSNVHAINNIYQGIVTPKDLYDILSEIWCKDTCAPRMQDRWTKENKTLGQCSITAFLAQDIFGGKVYGIPLENENFHCFNVVEDIKIDLTSEQFGLSKLHYDNAIEQFREVHFKKEEKRKRYEFLKNKLLEYCVKDKK